MKAKNEFGAKKVLFKMTPCCLAVMAMFAQHVYADTSSNEVATEESKEKPVAQLEKIVVTATRTPKILQKLRGLSKPLTIIKLRSKQRRDVKLLMY